MNLGLDEVVKRNGASGRLRFTTDLAEGVAHGLFQFIAVGTPPDEDGSADLQHVRAVARSIGEHLDDYRVVVNKSTVPVGTADVVRATIAEVLAERGRDAPFRRGFQSGISQGRRGGAGFHAAGPHHRRLRR
jgi:UDPglucose 6-dehydrogenase